MVADYTDNAELTAHMEEIAARKGSTPEAVRADMASSAALRRITQPGDITETVLFLAGPGAAGITGTVTQVTSGTFLEP